jgi:hypothetical protein
VAQQDPFGVHEVMHMSLFLAESVETQLLAHREVLANAEWRALAERACDALQALYQAVGAAHTGRA